MKGTHSTSLQERIHPGSQAKLGSLSDPFVPPQSHPEVTCEVPQVEHACPPLTPVHTDGGGPAISRPLTLTSNIQTKGSGGEE